MAEEGLIVTNQEAARMALGTPMLTNVNIAILHALLEQILSNIGCSDDKICIVGPELNILRHTLTNSQPCPITFNDPIQSEEDSEPKTIATKIVWMNEQLQSIQTDLESHLDDVHKYKLLSYESHKNYCKPCDPSNDIGCQLLQDYNFLKKLFHNIAVPSVRRVFIYEKLMHVLEARVQSFLDIDFKKMKFVPLLEEVIFKMKRIMVEYLSGFDEYLATLEEIQDMLDGKLDKRDIPPLKKYIIEQLNNINRRLEDIIRTKTCPKASGVIFDWEDEDESSEEEITNVCLKVNLPKKKKKKIIQCSVEEIPWSDLRYKQILRTRKTERSCGGRHTVRHPSEKAWRKSNLADDLGDGKVGDAETALIIGKKGEIIHTVLIPKCDASTRCMGCGGYCIKD